MSQPSSFTSATPSLSMTKKEPFSSVKPVVSGRVSALCRPAGRQEPVMRRTRAPRLT